MGPPLCQMEVVHPARGPPRPQLICFSLFRMAKTAYRAFDTYLHGLRRGIALLEANGRGRFDYRVYVDASVDLGDLRRALAPVLGRCPVTLVRYRCPAFAEGDAHHVDVFGMMVRFLPMFKGGDPTCPPYATVSVADADFDRPTFDLILHHHDVFDAVDPGVAVYAVGNVWYVFRQRHVRAVEGREWANPVLAQFLIVRKPLPLSIVQGWLACFPPAAAGPACAFRDVLPLLDWTAFPSFPYGADEQFLMHAVLGHCRKRRVPVCVHWKYEMSAAVFYAFHARKYTQEPEMLALADRLRAASGLTPQEAERVDRCTYRVSSGRSECPRDELLRAVGLAARALRGMRSQMTDVMGRMVEDQGDDVLYSECLQIVRGARAAEKRCLRTVRVADLTV